MEKVICNNKNMEEKRRAYSKINTKIDENLK
jgi:hypothetical protein